MQVKLLTHTPHPEKVCATAAKLCYSAGMPAMEDITPDKARPFLEKILALGHLSVLEHASFTFSVEGISRACSHQLVRHRLASFSQQSQRYVQAHGEFEQIIPPSIKNNPQALHEFHCAMSECGNAYGNLITLGIPAEDARFVLPNAAETKLIETMNARELLHFFKLRTCSRAQWEIRALANEMLRLVKLAAPALFSTAGPGCVTGTCPEGAMSCKAVV